MPLINYHFCIPSIYYYTVVHIIERKEGYVLFCNVIWKASKLGQPLGLTLYLCLEVKTPSVLSFFWSFIHHSLSTHTHWHESQSKLTWIRTSHATDYLSLLHSFEMLLYISRKTIRKISSVTVIHVIELKEGYILFCNVIWKASKFGQSLGLTLYLCLEVKIEIII